MLVDLLRAEIFGFILVFCRLGGAMMLLPGFGETYVLVRFRLLLAFLISFLLTPVVADHLPTPPEQTVIFVTLVAGEVVFGLFIGSTIRLAMLALNFGGTLIAMQSGLAAAAFFDPSEGTQSTITTNILTTAALVLIFVTGAHIFMLDGLAQTYRIHPPTASLPIEDMVELVVRLGGQALVVALKIAAPLTIMGLLVYAVMGILNRLMPNFQVFFVIVPAQLAVSLFILMGSAAGALMAFMGFLDLSILQVTGGR